MAPAVACESASLNHAAAMGDEADVHECSNGVSSGGRKSDELDEVSFDFLLEERPVASGAVGGVGGRRHSGGRGRN